MAAYKYAESNGANNYSPGSDDSSSNRSARNAHVNDDVAELTTLPNVVTDALAEDNIGEPPQVQEKLLVANVKQIGKADAYKVTHRSGSSRSRLDGGRSRLFTTLITEEDAVRTHPNTTCKA